MNNISGSIPQTFCFSLVRANRDRFASLNGNQLDGHLPPSLAQCRLLELLDVGNNKIDDSFLHWLATLPYLINFMVPSMIPK
ncbi:hypothetical protein ACOSP7_031332 [Xanthoceras sorbifolium]